MATEVTIPEAGEVTGQQSEYDFAFPVIPTVDEPEPPESVEEGLVSDLADFALDSTPEEALQSPGGSLTGENDLLFNFEEGEPFAAKYGKGAYATGTLQVLQWCQKALMTPKGAYAIYPPEYGSELERMKGLALPDSTLHAEITRTVVECLTYNPRVKRAAVLGIHPLPETSAVIINIELVLTTTDNPINFSLRG